MSDEQIIIVCLPVSSPVTPVRGSIVMHCMDCHQDVWIAPSGQAALTRADGILCAPCAYRAARDHPGENKIAILPGALEELRDDDAS